MNDELLDQAIRHYARALPAEMDQAWPLQQARWWNAAHGTPLRRPRHTLRVALGGFVVGVCAALSVTSASISPFAWSHTLASAFTRCGADLKDRSPLNCPLEFFKRPPAVPAGSGPAPAATSKANSSTPGGSITGAKTPTPRAVSSSGGPTSAPTPKSAPAVTSAPASAIPSCAAPVPAAGDLILNSSFETGLSGWGDYNSDIAQLKLCGVAPDGSYVNHVTYHPGLSSACACYSSADNKVIKSTTVGMHLHAVGWIRAASVSAIGKKATLVIRENHGTNYPGNQTIITLSASFQRVTVDFTTTYAGDTVDVYFSQQADGGPGAAPGDAFDMDNVQLFSS